MATTKDEIADWFRTGLKMGATHLIVACDTYDWEDYPVYVTPDQNVREVAREHGTDDTSGRPTIPNRNMQKVMEIYSLELDMESQLNERQAWHWD